MGKSTTTVKSPRSQKKKATSKVVPNVFVIPPIPNQEIEKFVQEVRKLYGYKS